MKKTSIKRFENKWSHGRGLPRPPPSSYYYAAVDEDGVESVRYL